MNKEKRLSFKNVSVFPLGKVISGLHLKESENMPVMNICDKYEALLNKGKHSFQLCEQFTAELSNVANTDITRNVVKKCKKLLSVNERDINSMCAVASLKESNLSYIAGNIEEKMSAYLIDKSDKNRSELHEAVVLFNGNPMINTILENLSYDDYESKHGKKLANLKSIQIKEGKTFTEDEVNQMISERMQELENNKKPAVKTSFREIDTHIELDSTIKKILENCGSNDKLAKFCMSYYNELNRGVSEEALYESFISGISNWNYMPAVDTQVSALKDRTSKYRQEIDLKKILETMSQTGSYYIVPLIEECVLDYINNKTLGNKAILKQRLYPFEYDPFVRDIEEVLLYDLSLPNTVYLGESVEKRNNYVHSEPIYSPVLYIKENESVFNVKGMYYVKKGNSISRLPKKDIAALPESFSVLCRYVNSPSVQIINETNEIKVYDGNDVAVISEGMIKINGKKVTTKELNSLCEHFNTMANEKNAFYTAVRILNENFNDIAYIDFVKHVSLNENAGHYVDVFRIKNNLFVTTVNKSNGISTFYKNVNPIQCRKYINEHMEMNIGDLFEDILPSQESVRRMIMEKRALYEGYIEKLQDKQAQFQELQNDPDVDQDVISDALSTIDDELEKAKQDYADYTKSTDDYLNGNPDDAEKSTDVDAGEYIDSTDSSTGSTETPAEMSTPIEDEPDTNINDNPDDNVFVDTLAPSYDEGEVSDFDGLLDTPAAEENEDSYKIVDLKYNYNVKANKTENKGEIVLIIPTVDMNGDIHNDMKRITFSIDETGKPVINNEYMPLDMYKAIVKAINDNPKTAEVLNDLKSGNTMHRSTEVEPAVDVVPDASSDAPATSSPAPQAEPSDEQGTGSKFDDILSKFSEDDDFDIDSLLADIDNDSEAGERNDESNTDNVNTEDVTDDSNQEPVEPVEQQSPAEQKEEGEVPTYPIDIDLHMDDIKPISKTDFEGDLDNAGIKHSQSESDSSQICFTISNKADARWLKNYFKEWKGFSEAEFTNFFPELKACMDNHGSVPTMKLESVILPYNKDFAQMFHVSAENGQNPKSIKLTLESVEDKAYLYKALKSYGKTHALCEDAKDYIENYENALLNEESVIKVPYSNFLAQKLSSTGCKVKQLNEDLYITVNALNAKKLKTLFESYYKDETPKSVKNFIKDISLNENVTITIEAEGKKIVLNTDDMAKGDKKESSSDGETPDEQFDPDKSFEQVTTFDGSSDDLMNPYKGNDDDDSEKDKDDDKDKDNKGDEKDDEKKEKNEGLDSDDSNNDSESKDKKSKKKIVIKAKKKKDNESNESVKEPDIVDEILNEGAKPTVYDNVKLSDGRRGQIICQMANGDFIVSVAGRTVECAQNSVSMVTERPDTVECPYKFDEATLKGLFEQYVHCGMFMNGIRMTPDDCVAKYSDYVFTPDNEKMPVIVEGQKLLIDRKYIKVFDEVNEFANVNEYKLLGESYYNTKDFQIAESTGNMSKPVRALVNKSDKWKLMNVPAGTFMHE